MSLNLKNTLISVILFSCLFLGFEKSGCAQENPWWKYPRKENETSIYVGLGPIVDLNRTFSHWDGPFDGCVEWSKSLDYSLGFEYFRYLNRHIAVGAFINQQFGHFSYSDWTDDYSAEEPILYKGCGNVPVAYTVAMIEVKLPWYYSKYLSLYSKVGFGGEFRHIGAFDYYCNLTTHLVYTNNDPIDVPDHHVSDGKFEAGTTIQLCPVGADFGNEKYRGFVECGVGGQGMLIGGFRYSF